MLMISRFLCRKNIVPLIEQARNQASPSIHGFQNRPSPELTRNRRLPSRAKTPPPLATPLHPWLPKSTKSWVDLKLVLTKLTETPPPLATPSLETKLIPAKSYQEKAKTNNFPPIFLLWEMMLDAFGVVHSQIFKDQNSKLHFLEKSKIKA